MKILITFFIALLEFFCRAIIGIMLLFAVGSVLPIGAEVNWVHRAMLVVWAVLPFVKLGATVITQILEGRRTR